MISGRASRAVGEDTVEAALVGGDAQDQVFFAGADGLEAVQVVVEEEKELFGILVEEDMFVGAQAVEEAIAAGCGFALGGAWAGGFLGILAVSIDLGLAGCARFIRIIPYAYWRAREARSFPLPYYWGGFGDSDGVLRTWLKTWGRDFLPGVTGKRPVRFRAKTPRPAKPAKRASGVRGLSSGVHFASRWYLCKSTLPFVFSRSPFYWPATRTAESARPCCRGF